jgi:hypothetical protein
MADPADYGGTSEVAFEAFGVRLGVSASTPELLDRIRPFFPPGGKPIPSSSEVDSSVSLIAVGEGHFRPFQDESPLAGGGIALEAALSMVDVALRHFVARTSREVIFIHAGVVAHAGKTIVMPAPSLGGKTTLVTTMVKRGATYFSDEYAVIDRDGVVHPYPKRLSIRDGGYAQTEHAVETLDGVAGVEPLPLGMIVVTTYKAGAEWKPKRLSGGAGALALLSNAVPAQERPKEVMEAVARAASQATVIESDRDEADQIAPLLLAELERHES